MATYHDVKELTGLSLSTISKYFNGLPVREANRQAIKAAVEQLNFRPNALARGLRSKRSQSVGVLLPAIDNSFHLRVIAGVERILRDSGISALVRSSGWDSAGGADPGEGVDFLTEKMVDGLIVVPTPADVDALAGVKEPVVLIDRLASGLSTDAVVLDNRGVGAQVAQLLADHGHREVAVIGGDERVWTMPERLAGFRQGAADRGLELAPQFVSHNPLSVEAGRAAMLELLRLKGRPTAVFAVNYELTLGAWIGLNESGLRVPEDISFVGFDATELAQATSPSMTYIAQPVDQIAAEAARLMVRRLQHEGEPTGPQIVTLPGRLVSGASVARL